MACYVTEALSLLDRQELLLLKGLAGHMKRIALAASLDSFVIRNIIRGMANILSSLLFRPEIPSMHLQTPYISPKLELSRSFDWMSATMLDMDIDEERYFRQESKEDAQLMSISSLNLDHEHPKKHFHRQQNGNLDDMLKSTHAQIISRAASRISTPMNRLGSPDSFRLGTQETGRTASRYLNPRATPALAIFTNIEVTSMEEYGWSNCDSSTIASIIFEQRLVLTLPARMLDILVRFWDIIFEEGLTEE